MTTMTLERPVQKQPSVLRGLPLVGNLIPSGLWPGLIDQ
jgi:hypothetical protein